MKKAKKWAVETALTARAQSGQSMASMMNMGGTGLQNAMLSMVMLTAAASPLGELEGREYAGTLRDHLLDAATAGGFPGRAEFVRLIESNQMTPRLQQLAADAVRSIGGDTKFFALLELISTPADMLGGAQ
ncbi:hypothetical protein [Janthinobacterium agaricidamnosum]|uniref:Uncharacterized protein n=1 Tax=Janthinobacterium agaricidamnosum NBRC 102515 = DSM 9628 TaxID=1349767 RepID=W0VA47_9BURK|nr:hypothetical protein [Janthinobacterium agaricidamnosum]CDG84147.1 hypothetical protein GJA_3531 [Janthinobacterium agaricidamnosum NBRC 102515 = DSM 9628]